MCLWWQKVCYPQTPRRLLSYKVWRLGLPNPPKLHKTIKVLVQIKWTWLLVLLCRAYFSTIGNHYSTWNFGRRSCFCIFQSMQKEKTEDCRTENRWREIFTIIGGLEQLRTVLGFQVIAGEMLVVWWQYHTGLSQCIHWASLFLRCVCIAAWSDIANKTRFKKREGGSEGGSAGLVWGVLLLIKLGEGLGEIGNAYPWSCHQQQSSTKICYYSNNKYKNLQHFSVTLHFSALQLSL